MSDKNHYLFDLVGGEGSVCTKCGRSHSTLIRVYLKGTDCHTCRRNQALSEGFQRKDAEALLSHS